MTKFTTSLGFFQTIARLEEIFGPRQYYLHRQVGGDGWRIKFSKALQVSHIEIDDPVMATFVQLKLKK